MAKLQRVSGAPTLGLLTLLIGCADMPTTEQPVFAKGGNQPSPSVPYYVTASGAIITNPSPLATEQLLYAWNIQTDTVDLAVRYNAAHAGRAYMAFVNSQAEAANCRKGNKGISAAIVTALLAEFTKSDTSRHGMVLRIDSLAVTTGRGSGEFRTHYAVNDPASPFHGDEIHVKVFTNDRVAPDWGKPLVTRDSVDAANGAWYTFHADSGGTANVWWRGGGPYETINCKFRDAITVRVEHRP